MTCGRLTNEAEMSLFADHHVVPRFEFITGWLPSTGLDTARMVLKIKNASSNYFKARPVIQTAAVRTNKPNSTTLLDSWYTDDGESCTGNIDLTSSTEGTFFARFGIAYMLSQAGTPESADVFLQANYALKGRVVGSAHQQVVAPDTSSRYLPISDWVPAMEVSKFKVSYIVTDSGADFRSRVVYQTAATSIESPGSWTAPTEEDTYRSSNVETCTGELTPSLSTVMWVRFGIDYKSNSASNVNAYLSAMAAIRGG